MTFRYAFSTLGCPGWAPERVADEAVRMGYDAVELRLLGADLIDPTKHRVETERAVATIRAAGLNVCAYDTSVRLNLVDAAQRASQIDDLLAWIELAGATRVPVLRVFGGPNATEGPRQSDDDADAWVVEGLQAVAPHAERAQVSIALETHDAFASARRVGRLLRKVNSPAVGALWDSHHPYRMGESAEVAAEALHGLIAHVHVKDARRRDAAGTDWDLVLMGEGEVPVREQLAILHGLGYPGVVSVEWEKKWHPHLADPEIALPQHLAWLRANEPAD